jgi:glutamyl-tRNA synthetase
MTVRTRFEPSPSGSIHVGTAMTAMFNWLFARRHGGAFVLRVADTDTSRVVPEGMRSVTEDLWWLGLRWDEGPEVGGPDEPYFQSERGALYRASADALLASGAAYPCYCTSEELDAARKLAQAEKRPPRYNGRCRDLSDAERSAFEAEGRASVVRFRVEPGETTVTDLVRGEVTFAHADIEDFVVMRANGSALYQLAVSVDDMTMGMTHIFRGEDIYSSTPKQVMIIRALGKEPPQYGHVPLIVGPDRKPLSKRYGDVAVAAYRHNGFLPDVLLNYLVTLAWSIGDGSTEKFTIDELIRVFDPSGMTRNPSAFDIDKLTSWNGDAIRAMPAADFMNAVAPFLVREDVVPEVGPEARGLLSKLAPLIQDRTKRLDEVPGQVRFLFVEDVAPDEKAARLLDAERAPLLAAVADVLAALDPWTPEAVGEALKAWADSTGLKRKDALQPVRAAVTGSLISPPLFESIEALGRDRAMARLRAAVTAAGG